MSENEKVEGEGNLPEENQALVSLIKSMNQRLDSLEKKIDLLIQESKQESFKSRQSPRPPRDFGRSPSSRPQRDSGKSPYRKERKHEGRKEEGDSAGKFYHGRPFKKKKRSGTSNYRSDKKPFSKSSRVSRDRA